MNRRAFIASGGLALIPASASALSEPPAILIRFFDLLATGDLAIVDEIIAEDYAPLYPLKSTLPGREAYRQRRASDTFFAPYEAVSFELITWAQSEGFIFFLSENHLTQHDGKELIVPYFGMLVVESGFIKHIQAHADEDYMFEQLT